jgi:hypothetical protein
MQIWIDTTTGTWGDEPEAIRVIELSPEFVEHDMDNLTDQERIDMALEGGVPLT